MTNCYLLSDGFCDSEIVIIANIVVISSVGIKRIVCTEGMIYSQCSFTI